MGAAGIALGIFVLVATSRHLVHTQNPNISYFFGGVLIVFGVMRIARSFGQR